MFADFLVPLVIKVTFNILKIKWMYKIISSLLEYKIKLGVSCKIKVFLSTIIVLLITIIDNNY